MKVYQIEVSNYCNLKCRYCPHPNQSRAMGYMDFSTFEKAIQLVKICNQETVFLHNFGEPLLHPNIIDFIGYCIKMGVKPNFYSNGALLTYDMAKKLEAAGLREISISEHIAGMKSKIEELLTENQINISITETYTPTKETIHNWAGQTRHKSLFNTVPIETENPPCIFQRQNAAVILWDGRINTCCIENEQINDLGTIDDYINNPHLYKFNPIPRCSTCDLMRGEEEL